MARLVSGWLHGWWSEPLRVDLALKEVMSDLDPRWDDWAKGPLMAS